MRLSDHERAQGGTVKIDPAQFAELTSLLGGAAPAAPVASGAVSAPSTMALSDEQFQKLVDLLTPGYELALMYKAQANTNPPLVADRSPDPVVEPTEPETVEAPVKVVPPATEPLS